MQPEVKLPAHSHLALSSGEAHYSLSNMACNVTKKYLGKHLKANLKVVGPAFIRSYPEFDLLIVDVESKQEEFTDAYNRESVHLVIEVKSHGT